MVFQLEPVSASIIFDDRAFKRGLSSLTSQGDKAAKGLEKSFSRLNGVIGKLGTAFAGIFAFRTVRSFIQAGDELEDIRISLEGLLGTAERAQSAFKAIENLALETKPGIEELSRAFVTLESAGLGSLKNLELASDVATVFNRDVNDVALALRSLETETLRNAFGFDKVSTAAGKYSASVNGVVVAQAKSRGAFRQAILDYVETSRFAGAARKANDEFGSGLESISNSIKILSDRVRQALAPAIQEIAKDFKGVVDELIQFVDTNKTLIAQQAVKIYESIANSIRIMNEHKEVFAAMAILAVSAPAFNTISKSLGLIATAVSALAGISLVKLLTDFTVFSAKAARVGVEIEVIGGKATGAINKVSTLGSALAALVTRISGGLIAIGEATAAGIALAFAKVIAIGAVAVGAVKGLIESIAAAFDITIDWKAAFEALGKVAKASLNAIIDLVTKVAKIIGRIVLGISKVAELLVESLVLAITSIVAAMSKLPPVILDKLGFEGAEKAAQRWADSTEASMKRVAEQVKLTSKELSKLFTDPLTGDAASGAVSVPRPKPKKESPFIPTPTKPFVEEGDSEEDKLKERRKKDSIALEAALERIRERVAFLDEQAEERNKRFNDLIQARKTLYTDEERIQQQVAENITLINDLAREGLLTEEEKLRLLKEQQSLLSERAQFFAEFAKNLDNSVQQGFRSGLRAAIEGEGIKGFFRELGNRLKDTIIDAIADALLKSLGFQKFFEQLFAGVGLSTVGGGTAGGAGDAGVIPILSQIGGFFGFAEGGVVPRTPGSSPFRDSVPAMLTPGEVVIPKAKAAGLGVTNLNVSISAVDAASFQDLIARNPQAITAPILADLNNNGQLGRAIRGR